MTTIFEEAAWLSYPQAQKLTGLGRTTLWSLVSSGEIRAARVGRAVRINRRSLDEYMESRIEDVTRQIQSPESAKARRAR